MAYIIEVDDFELLEESHSSKNSSSRVEGSSINPIYCEDSDLSIRYDSSVIRKDKLGRGFNAEKRSELVVIDDDDDDDLSYGVSKLSLASTSTSLKPDELDAFTALLAHSKQSALSSLSDVFSKYCDLENIVKVVEGTYEEAFQAGNSVCKIVPIDGDFLVNGELQKRSKELLEEVILSQTLNQLRGHEGGYDNSCTIFIETKDVKVCQGVSQGTGLCYVVFVLENGGKDLESFAIFNFDEARSLLAQVTAALAVAEAAYEFEHRDLHWGNVLLSRNDSETVEFTLDGKSMLIRTFGISVSIIDFTLSRINTGESVLFVDLFPDPGLFEGPKGDKQSETYRKMKCATKDRWEGSFPVTNVLWLLYLVDTLLTKKSFERSRRNERDLCSLQKRLSKYKSAREAKLDPFFADLFIECCV